MTTVLPSFPMARSHPLDPPPRYRELGDEQPVFRVRTPRGPAWVVTRYKDCVAVLTNPTFSSDPRTPGFPSYMSGDVPPPPGFFLQLDMPDHPRLRRLVTREFLIGRMEALRPRMRVVLNQLIDKMLASGKQADLVADLAYPMAATMICELVDVPTRDQKIFIGLTDTILDRSTPPERTTEAAVELMAYFGRLVEARKREPKDDLLGRLIKHERVGMLNAEEVVGLTALLVLSGYDTMAQMIGLGTLTLLQHPEQLAELRADPSLMLAAVEEMLRYLSINHAGLPRAATKDTMVDDTLIRAGDGVLVMLNAANRDGSEFADPDAFDIHRTTPHKHLAFGHGLHKCIGLTLARVELSTVFSGLFDRVPTLRVREPIEDLSFRDDMVLYGVRELPVSW